MFADAYIEGGRQFTNKNAIFELAVERLAKESNPAISSRGELSFDKKIKLAEEVFAKLLLSGSDGISSSDINSERLYPRLGSLITDTIPVECILATRLFRPGEKTDQHAPVHKIIVEYCAANYMVKRLTASTNRLSLLQCLSIIAPNLTVRDELRGLVGWMAALGNQPIQEALIDRDPYAVLANGDPSRLLTSSKRRLLRQLRKIAEEDPYFRRNDIWRTFSAADFFTEDVIDELKELFIQNEEDGHLRGLLLELLADSKVIPLLANELRQLALLPDGNEYIRELACQRLLAIENYDHKENVDTLITEGSITSLEMAVYIINKQGVHNFNEHFLANFLHICAKLYPGHKNQLEGGGGKRYFIKHFISNLNLEMVECLLDNLTYDLICKCGKEPYACDCRNGISKIVGSLLDRFFELSLAPFRPEQIWGWIKNLNFHGNIGTKQSLAVRILKEDDSLRQGIIRIIFEKETDRNRIREIHWYKCSWHCHSGLQLQLQDHKFIADIAFGVNNIALWSHFIATHQFNRDSINKGFDELRRHMKLQAREKPAFLYAWSRSNRTAQELVQQHRQTPGFSSRGMKRRHKKRDDIRKANIKYLQDNRELIEGGKHWECLLQFADLVLEQPTEIEHAFGDETIVRNALCNCLDFIEPHIPNLQELAKLQCESKSKLSEKILYAACLEIHRTQGSLEGIKSNLLAALRIHLDMHYSSVTNEERETLKKEVNKWLFPDIEAAESFLRAYVEPQLNIKGCMHPKVSWLRYDASFEPLKASLPLEWLQRFHEISISSMNELFELAAEFGERKELEALVMQRCKELLFSQLNKTNDDKLEERRTFWLLRAFYFLEVPPYNYRDWLKENKNLIIPLKERSEWISRKSHPYWPILSSIKIEAIFDAFIEVWPKVDLPDHWGTSSPVGENAYRFLTEVIWNIGKDEPDASIPVLDRLLYDQRYEDFYPALKSIRSSQLRKKALKDFEAPTPKDVVALLDGGEIATVEGLRALLLEELHIYQVDLNGSETTSKDIFYETGKHLGEVDATLRIADRMRLRLEHKGITVTPEHQLKNANRCDFTCAKVLNNQRKLLVTEVKGQWHRELYSAASEQLHERYSIHPNAEQQGVYLVLWFGEHEDIAGKRTHSIKNAQELKESIEIEIPLELKGLIDVFVLDVSKS